MRAAAPLALAALAATGCLASPPGHSPSSVRLLYSRATEDSTGAHTDIYFLVARSGNELRLTGEGSVDLQPTFAAGLRQVFYVREIDGRQEIWSMELDGSGERVVLSAEGERFLHPAVAPDETRIAYARIAGGRSRVGVAAVDGSNPRPLMSEAYEWSQPAWSPDGGRLALVRGSGAERGIFIADSSGADPRPIRAEIGGPQGDPAWSPDGTRIAFTLGAGSDAEIVIAPVAGGEIVALTDNGVEDRMPSWSPSGERLVFVSRRPDDRYNLWIIDADGSDADDLTSRDDADARHPDWL